MGWYKKGNEVRKGRSNESFGDLTLNLALNSKNS